MQHHVFISYSRRDQAWVDPLVAELARRGVKYWLDREGIPFSVPWREEVEDAVQSCDLFLVCDSDHWRTSDPCATEAGFAVRYGKVRLEVSVGQDLTRAAQEIDRTWRQAAHDHGTATELLVRAREWDRDGRRGKTLVSRRIRRQFDALPNVAPVEVAFISASRRRSRRKAAVSMALTLVVLVAYLSGRVAPETEREVNKRLAEQAAIYVSVGAALAAIEDDPYKGLELASDRGDNESAAYATIHEEASAVNLPDDAFTLPEPARQFTDPTVSSQVRVIAQDGDVWVRNTNDRTQRSARQMADRPAAAPDGAARRSDVEIRLQAGSSRIQVLREGGLWRTIVLGSAARTARLSPDARWAVVATDTGIALVDIARGTVRDVLRGAPAPVTDLVWTQRSERIWALAGRSVVSWRVTDGTVLLDQPDEWFAEVLPARDTAHLWVASRNGALRLIERDSGTIVRTVRAKGPIHVVAADPSGSIAAVVDTASKLQLVELDTGTAEAVNVPGDCLPGRPVFSPDGHALYVPCRGADVLVVDTRSRRSTGRIDVPEPGVGAVALDRSGNRLFLGTVGGGVYSITPGSGKSPAWLYRVGCAPDIAAIATGAGAGGGPRLLPVGEGTGLSGCTQVAHAQDGTYEWNAFMDSRPDSVLALAAAFDPTGKAFAIGYSDGSVVLHPSDNGMPRRVLPRIAGGVRSMLSLPSAEADGTTGDLYAATRSGLLVRIPWCPSCLSNEAMAREAGQRLRQAESLGLYKPSATTSMPTP
ncbi:TIR domain-containing protein [Streptomyces albipurpureus]|uniref:TIR domain-containing protein n=1 Tax=Streptomyces albipurpureus TaxID=2897419 RepID=A0ABT0ULT3_9ACTN|nr:TIR domain-containing protein [Streptomyces sp. CWNU-1]MCM2388358.1 TIR domain-containing protein [Streptomyces sp. CWNU-1]